MARPILITAHPGHDLRLFGWVNATRPFVSILTDGSGSTGQARTQYSRDVLTACGASPGTVFGALSDRAWYEAILNQDLSLFLDAADAIAMAASANALVVSDPVEGYNPMHDLCSVIADRVARRIGGTRAAYQLMYSKRDAEALPLAAETLMRKRSAIRAYEPIATEAAELCHGDDTALADERLWTDRFTWPAELDAPPLYEQVGEARCKSGVYVNIIRYAQHIRPIAVALRNAPL